MVERVMFEGNDLPDVLEEAAKWMRGEDMVFYGMTVEDCDHYTVTVFFSRGRVV